MGKKSKAPPAPPPPPPQPYMGPGRNQREVLLRDHGYESDLDNAGAVDQFLAVNYGGRLPGPNDPPARGTAAYYAYEQKNAAALSAAKKSQAALPASQQSQVNADLQRQRAEATQRQQQLDEAKAIQDAIERENLRQTNIRGVAGEVGYSGDPGNDRALMDYIIRNSMEGTYEQKRGAYDPGYQFDRNQKSPVLEARNSAESTARKRVTDRGLNYGEFEGDIDTELDRVYKGVPYGATNPDSYFDPNTTDSVLSRIEGDRRTGYVTQANQMLPEDYGTRAFADTADDDIIGRILDEQYGQARTLVDRSRDRGTLTSSGYDSALKALSQQRSAGSSKLQGVGGNVLTGYRGQLSDIVGEGRTAASGYRLGQSYDPNAYTSRLDAKKTDLTGRLESDIRSNLGGEQLFDPQGVLNTGFSAQGAQNTGRAGILDVLAQREKERGSKRGVGNEGSF